MAVETCQLLAIVASDWYHGYGTLLKADGTPYSTSRGAFRKHPCTIWTAESIHNASWLIQHGLALCEEFELRYKKAHACYNTLLGAYQLFPEGNINEVTPFVRAMPDELKFDRSIDTFEAYKKYIKSKIWPSTNYLRIPSRKPEWL